MKLHLEFLFMTKCSRWIKEEKKMKCDDEDGDFQGWGNASMNGIKCLDAKF